MLGGNCSPCCGSSFNCDDGLVVKVDASVSSDFWLAHHPPFFVLLKRLQHAGSGCSLRGTVSAFRSGGAAPCIGIKKQEILFEITTTNNFSFRTLFDECENPGVSNYIGISELGGALFDLDSGQSSGEIEGFVKWWTPEAWLAAKNDPLNEDVPSDAIVLDETDVPNPWDFSKFDVPQSYTITISGLPVGDGHFAKLQGPRVIPCSTMNAFYDAPFFWSDFSPVDYAASLPTQPTKYAIHGQAVLTFDYKNSSGLYPLRLFLLLYMHEFGADPYTWLRSTLINTMPLSNGIFYTPQPGNHVFSYAPLRQYPDGLVPSDSFSVPVYVATEQASGTYHPYQAKFGPAIANCSVSISSVL